MTDQGVSSSGRHPPWTTRRMTAIAAPASVLPAAPAMAGGYDKDAAEGFGALLAQAGSANAANDKVSTRDTKAQDNKASNAKAADAKADRASDAKAEKSDKA